MGQRATHIELEDRFVLLAGEPILDTQEGTLSVVFEDLTARIFNWDKVVDYYYMTAEEYGQFREDMENNA